MSDLSPRASLKINATNHIATPIPPVLQQRMAAFANRSGAPLPTAADFNTKRNFDQAGDALRRADLASHPVLHPSQSFPRPKPASLAAKRMRPDLNLAAIDPKLVSDDASTSFAGLGLGRPLDSSPKRSAVHLGTPFSNFSKIVDASGALNFEGKAILHASGVNFSNGISFAIAMDDLILDEELGRGNYGTVKKVIHKPTKVAMAMKEIRLELEDAKLRAIIMELDVLHRAIAPEIVEFYGAFFIESCVYYCMEYMDAGSLDKLQGAGVPENVLARIACSVTRGLRFLKENLNIIHRDVKPTNILINRRGQIKLCDFGVSGELNKSLARTNIGCQSYMAPERIKGESRGETKAYTVSSDIWSLGLTMIEIAMGQYPYPPETYENVFSQLQAIVNGDPPELPEDYSEVAKDWVGVCMWKDPERRASYKELEEHEFLEGDRVRESKGEVEQLMQDWVEGALKWREERRSRLAKAHLPTSV